MLVVSWDAYFLFLHRVCCLAQCLRLKVFKLLLSLIYDYSLFVDPSSLGNTTEELDMVLSVTCTHAKKRPPISIIWPHKFIHTLKGLFYEYFYTSGVYTGVDLHLRVRRDHAGPPWIGSHFGPHQIADHKLFTEARLLNYRLMMNLWNLETNINSVFACKFRELQKLRANGTCWTCLWCLWYSFDSGFLRLLCLRCFYELWVHVGVVCGG